MNTWTTEQVAQRFDEAVSVLNVLPQPKSLGYAKRWPDMMYLPREIERQAPAPMRLQATPQQITRMEETLTWITWVQPQTRQLIWNRAEALPWRLIARREGLSKTTAQRHWQKGLEVIADKLTQTHQQKSVKSDDLFVV